MQPPINYDELTPEALNVLEEYHLMQLDRIGMAQRQHVSRNKTEKDD